MTNRINQLFSSLIKTTEESPLSTKQFVNFIKIVEGDLYFLVEKTFGRTKEFTKVVEYYGAYEISVLALDVIKSNIQNRSINKIDNFCQYFLKCVYFELKNKSRLKNFKNYNALNLFQESTPEWNSQEFQYPEIKSVLNKENQLEKIIEKQYLALENGDIIKSKASIKYYERVLGKTSGLSDDELRYYKSQVNLFRANLFLAIGRMSLAYKYIREAIIDLSKIQSSTGKEFLFKAINLYAMMNLNKGNFIEGIKSFNQNIFNIENLNKKYNSNELEWVGLESKLLLSMFIGGEKFHISKELLGEVEYEAGSNVKTIYEALPYAKAYLYIDNNYFDEASDILGLIQNNIAEYSPINKMRFYTANAELYSCSFQSKGSSNLSISESSLFSAELLNSTIGSSYFSSIHRILRGNLEQKRGLVIEGLRELKESGYLHYHNWYARRLRLI